MYLNQNHDWFKQHHPKKMDDMGYYAMMLVANAYQFLGEVDNALFYYTKATEFNPYRNEHYLSLVNYYEQLGQYRNMLNITSILVNPSRKNPFPDYSFLIENNAYCDTGNLCNELHAKALNYVNNL
jgi:tetratricopeptide (TPR) repeat protein